MASVCTCNDDDDDDDDGDEDESKNEYMEEEPEMRHEDESRWGFELPAGARPRQVCETWWSLHGLFTPCDRSCNTHVVVHDMGKTAWSIYDRESVLLGAAFPSNPEFMANKIGTENRQNSCINLDEHVKASHVARNCPDLYKPSPAINFCYQDHPVFRSERYGRRQWFLHHHQPPLTF